MLNSDKGLKRSRIIWLASYPRSGNTLIRILLNNNFALKSHSIYNDVKVIGRIPKIAEVVGHIDMNWSFLGKSPVMMTPEDYSTMDSMRYDQDNLVLIKTHSCYNEGFFPDSVIYIYRDGRAVLNSYAAYQVKFNDKQNSKQKIIENILCTEGLAPETRDDWSRHVGSWSNHTSSWLRHSRERILFLKYEDVIMDIDKTIDRIAGFLSVAPLCRDFVSFETLNRINPDFFRAGKRKSWQHTFRKNLHALFWIINYETMFNLGYENDRSPICDMLPLNFKSKSSFSSEENIGQRYLDEMDGILQYCADVFNKNLLKHPQENGGELGEKLRKAYLGFLQYYTGKTNKTDYKWMQKWHFLFK